MQFARFMLIEFLWLALLANISEEACVEPAFGHAKDSRGDLRELMMATLL